MTTARKPSARKSRRVHRNLTRCSPVDFHFEVDLGVAAGEKLAGFVGDIDFGVQCASGEVDSVGGAHDLAFEATSGILLKFERCAEAGVHMWERKFRGRERKRGSDQFARG